MVPRLHWFASVCRWLLPQDHPWKCLMSLIVMGGKAWRSWWRPLGLQGTSSSTVWTCPAVHQWIPSCLISMTVSFGHPGTFPCFQFFVKGPLGTRVLRVLGRKTLQYLLDVPTDAHAICGSCTLRLGGTVEEQRICHRSTVCVLGRFRGGAVGPPGRVPREWQCSVCSAIRCWPTRKSWYRCGNPRDPSKSVSQKLSLASGKRPCPSPLWCLPRFCLMNTLLR